MEIKLIKLICPNCNSKILSLKSDNLHFCSFCGKGYYVNQIQFIEVKTIYVKEKIKEELIKIYLPFWDLRCDIDFEGGSFYEFANMLKFISEDTNIFLEGKNNILDFNSKKIDFIIPAFGTTNRYLLSENIGFHYTINRFDFEIEKPYNMLGGKYTINDLVPILKAFIFSITEKKELIVGKKLNISIVDNKILGIPFYVNDKFLIEGIFGKKIFLDAVENIDEIIKILNIKIK